MYSIMRTDSEIDETLNDAASWEEVGRSDCPNETYESGVQAGIRWVLGQSNDKPIENAYDDKDEGD